MAAASSTADRNPLARVPSPMLVVGGICSVQFGSALAATVFHRAGPSGVVLLRLAVASAVLLVLWRPRPRSLSPCSLPT